MKMAEKKLKRTEDYWDNDSSWNIVPIDPTNYCKMCLKLSACIKAQRSYVASCLERQIDESIIDNEGNKSKRRKPKN